MSTPNKNVNAETKVASWYDSFVFFKNHHQGQKYKDGLEYWHHLYKVATILDTVTKQCGEIGEETRKAMLIAATGHDSLEDTKITKEEIKEKFGEQVLSYIEGMTNDVGDHDTKSYEEKMLNAPEEVRLIKMCDSIDNYQLACYRALDNDPDWLKEKIMPIMENMYQNILKTPFVSYPKTAEHLKIMLINAHTLAHNTLKLAKGTT